MRLRATTTTACILLSGAFSGAVVPGSALWAQELGSVVPCAVPMSWEIAAVDPRFGITEAQALAAAREAAAMWERAVGRELFTFEADPAFPISFEFDDRQAELRTRLDTREALDAVGESLERRKAELERAAARFEAAQAAYGEAARAYEGRMAAHNTEVQGWNERGGAPADVRAELERTREALANERAALDTRERELREEYERLRDRTEELNRGIREHARDEERFAREFPLVASESGRYDENVEGQGRTLRSISREIRIFRFGDDHDLVLILAHELGHALGLGHVDASGSVMSAVLGSLGDSERLMGPSARDVSMLSSRCPAL